MNTDKKMNFLYVFDFVNILYHTQENFSEIFFLILHENIAQILKLQKISKKINKYI